MYKRKKKSTVIIFFSNILVCLFIFGCRSADNKRIQQEEQEQNIQYLMKEGNYIIKLNMIVASNGLYYSLPKDEYYIEVEDEEINMLIPAFDIDFALMPNIKDEGEILLPKEQTINLSSNIFEKSYAFYPLDMQTIHLNIRDIEPRYDISVAVAENGESTIYIKQGLYKNISFLGNLLKNDKN